MAHSPSGLRVQVCGQVKLKPQQVSFERRRFALSLPAPTLGESGMQAIATHLAMVRMPLKVLSFPGHSSVASSLVRLGPSAASPVSVVW